MKYWKAVKLLTLYVHTFGDECALDYEKEKIHSFYANLDPNNCEDELSEGQKKLIRDLYKKYIFIDFN